MHHSLRVYSRYRELFLRYYIFQAKWTGIPLLGRLVRAAASAYGRKASSACLLTLDEAYEIVESSEGVAVGPCTCREVFRNCDGPREAEIMLGTSRNVFISERPHDYREITKAEAREILSECHRKGLIQTIVRCREHFYAICNCCTCCCVPYRLKKDYGIGTALTRHPDIVREFREHDLSDAA